MSQAESQLAPQVFRATHQEEGWKEIFSPATGAMRYLSYARLVFGANVRSHKLETGDKEWVLFCIKPQVSVTVKGQTYELGLHDMIYVPRQCVVEVTGDVGADLALGGSPAHVDTEPQLVRFNEIKDNPEYFFDVGLAETSTKRRIFNMVGNNVKASRLMAGFTIGQPSAWTSWPPHEHSTSKEEFYLFFDMPKPAFSVQFVYETPESMEFQEVVRDGDCVTIPGGYHPTAAAPGYSSVFLWVMAAFDPEKDRDFKHGITIQPDYNNVKFV